jgi:hypothetical protein
LTSIPTPIFWELFDLVSSALSFNVTQHLWALNLIQVLILTPDTRIGKTSVI